MAFSDVFFAQRTNSQGGATYEQMKEAFRSNFTSERFCPSISTEFKNELKAQILKEMEASHPELATASVLRAVTESFDAAAIKATEHEKQRVASLNDITLNGDNQEEHAEASMLRDSATGLSVRQQHVQEDENVEDQEEEDNRETERERNNRPYDWMDGMMLSTDDMF